MNVEEVQDYFKMSDGFRLFCRCWKASTEIERVVVGIHGGGDYSGWFKVIGPKLAEDGSQVYALDLRGFGNSLEDGLPRGDTKDFQRHLQDIDDAINCVRRDHVGKKIHGLGHSAGSAYLLWYAANHPESLGSLVLAGASSIVKALSTRSVAIELFLANLFAPKRMYEQYKSSFAEDRDPEEVRIILQEPLQASRLSFRYIANSKRVLFDGILNNAKRVKIPTLMLQGDEDFTALLEGAKRLYESLGTKDKSIKIFSGADHWFYDTFSPAMPRLKYDPAKREYLFSIVKDWLRTH